MTFLILIAAVAWTSLAQQTEWGQCGGEGYTGTATCVKGAVCSALNIYYSQCLLAPTPTGCITRTEVGGPSCSPLNYATFTPPCEPTPDCVVLEVMTQPCSCGPTLATTTYCPSKCPPAGCATDLSVRFACPTSAPVTTTTAL